jgi:hypothetical protein
MILNRRDIDALSRLPESPNPNDATDPYLANEAVKDSIPSDTTKSGSQDRSDDSDTQP